MKWVGRIDLKFDFAFWDQYFLPPHLIIHFPLFSRIIISQDSTLLECDCEVIPMPIILFNRLYFDRKTLDLIKENNQKLKTSTLFATNTISKGLLSSIIKSSKSSNKISSSNPLSS